MFGFPSIVSRFKSVNEECDRLNSENEKSSLKVEFSDFN